MAGPSSGSNYLTSDLDSLAGDLNNGESLPKGEAELATVTQNNFSIENLTKKGLLEEQAKNQPPISDNQGSSPAAGLETPYYVYGENSSANTYPVSFAQNLFGANTDVVAPLEKINFESSFDGSLQNAIAYIVPWKRTGFNSRTPANPTATDTPASQNIFDVGLDLGIDLKFEPPADMSDLYGGTGIGTTGDPLSSPNFFSSDNNLPSFLGDTTPPKWDTDQSKWYDGSTDYQVNTQIYTPTTDVKGNKPPTQDQQAAQEKQKALGSEIPIGLQQGILAGTSFLAGSLLQDNPQLSSIVGTGINQVAGSVFNVPTGPIYVGNENGIVNQVISGASSLAALFGVNIPRGLTTTVRPDRQPNTPKDFNLNVIPSNRTDGAWQFLFNPSELGLSLGPKYSESETWGVMDAKESGTPLQFQRMSNPKLKFSGIKLNGYVFGRQVEDLEQGLFKLLMTAGGADNGASAGPQVLEFVWGKKTFGPCVIKDISITEKMWDNGLLVNADLNFTLEKIPEWTVNDGQVSVYAPYTQPTQTAPEEQKKETPDEGDKSEPALVPTKCVQVRDSINASKQLIDKSIDTSSEIANVRVNYDYITSAEVEMAKNEFATPAEQLIQNYSAWLASAVAAESTLSYSPKCSNSNLIGELSRAKNQEVRTIPFSNDTETDLEKIRSDMRNFCAVTIPPCVNEITKSLQATFDANCSSVGGGNAGGAQSIDPNAPAYIPPYSQQNQ
ncbi:virion structural protein and packaging [Cyanophage S-TIM5]|uniref:Virion structural protein and packaging n=1 Tax=Cyanophage S-TIM5 TaxID=1137745 RepID=H6WG14_9CAUD|nr:virion structural protein and packaging [Cyanophage S-TIM5]AEZ65738.1 virion structural protein and packaging [Cyanophage S-TIM5]UYE96909.1 virion structural protein [Cyanophage S-TIM66]